MFIVQLVTQKAEQKPSTAVIKGMSVDRIIITSHDST